MKAPSADDLHLFWFRESDHLEYLLEGIPGLLKPVANSRPEFTGRCFYLLWELGKDLAPPVTSARESEHPVLVMGEIAKAEYWKPLAVSEAALAWVKRKALDGSMQGSGNPPWFLLAELLKPFFRIISEERWSSFGALHLRSHLLSISETARIREVVISLCRDLAYQGDLSLALGLADVIDEAIQPLWIPYGGCPTSSRAPSRASRGCDASRRRESCRKKGGISSSPQWTIATSVSFAL